MYPMRAFLASMVFALALFGPVPAGAGEEKPVELYPVVQDGKWGYMNREGKIAIQPQFEAAWDFTEGLARVQVGGLRGFIDPAGKMAIEPKYFIAWEFSEGLAAVMVPTGWFDKSVNKGYWTYIDKTGKVAVEPKGRELSLAESFHEGEACVGFIFNVHMRYSHMNTKGEIRPFTNKPAGRFSEGLAAFASAQGKYGYIDHTAKEVISYQYDAAGPFCGGLARVQTNKKWVFIDKTGKQAFGGEFDQAHDFSEDLAAVRVGPKWGCIDGTGKTVIEPQFDFIAPFSEGLARVVVGGKVGFIGKAGKIVIEPKYDIGWSFSNGLARVEVGGKQGYIDHSGRYVWEPTK